MGECYDDANPDSLIITAANFSGCVYPSGNPCHWDVAASTPFGGWDCWVVELLNIGTTAHKMNVYRNDSKIFGLQGNMAGFNKKLDFVQWGANINSAPQQDQSRLFREIGIYTGRPSMVDLVS